MRFTNSISLQITFSGEQEPTRQERGSSWQMSCRINGFHTEAVSGKWQVARYSLVMSQNTQRVHINIRPDALGSIKPKAFRPYVRPGRRLQVLNPLQKGPYRSQAGFAIPVPPTFQAPSSLEKEYKTSRTSMGTRSGNHQQYTR
ncbi:hypothetical protein PoB_000174200 [Plakobranchus ocellatus]|uniref:Uncharacterized protein n=1 Tax=Plakobranchus ocellatus TaxID=259542 RepID=A0AAV3XYM5_9GAST|nr:hypothetical protein PoB_000174200 [Plakobranchus ocellatus]